MQEKHPAPLAFSYPFVVVAFVDIVGFTTWASQADPDALIVTLSEFFTLISDRARPHNIEVIKTIGDAVLLVAGRPRSAANGGYDEAKATASIADLQGVSVVKSSRNLLQSPYAPILLLLVFFSLYFISWSLADDWLVVLLLI